MSLICPPGELKEEVFARLKSLFGAKEEFFPPIGI